MTNLISRVSNHVLRRQLTDAFRNQLKAYGKLKDDNEEYRRRWELLCLAFDKVTEITDGR